MVFLFVFKKISQVKSVTVFPCFLPGALSLMLVMSYVNKKASFLVFCLTQSSPIIFGLILVPFISFLFNHEPSRAIEHNDRLTEVLN
ncbi:AbrB family transcriptional regulator, partial [Staphylococcus hyicus]